jgi:hypothetical protein
MIQRCNDCPFDYPDKICDYLNCLIDIYKEQVEQLEKQNKQMLDALVKTRDYKMIYEELDELIISITGKKPEELNV